MSVDRLYRNLMNKLINANIDLDAYLQLRKAKGYMSVSENDHLRHDCPSYIAVDVDKLESCLAVLRLNIHKLNDSKPITHA